MRYRMVAVGSLAIIAASASLAKGPVPFPQFPEITQTTRPWTYWWWPGSAVDPTNLAAELRRYHDAGLGGVHIIPIYGAQGYDQRYVTYLSPRWMDLLHAAVAEAAKLGMGADMTMGTGWCFGGPTVSDRDANARLVVKTIDLQVGQPLLERFDRASTQALVAYAQDGRVEELTRAIRSDGAVTWRAVGCPWRVYAVSQRPSGQRVKRAAPGGEGPMLNPFYGDGLRRYLAVFADAFAAYRGAKPRAMYQDSYEYVCDWSPDMLAEFARRRGYHLEAHLPELLGSGTDEATARVKADYRETVSDLVVEHHAAPWVKWCHQHGFLARYEAHGAPANLLDLYASADIPETEMFHSDREPLVSKLASSAAHVMGRRLVGSETGTWLAEHFTETLGEMKSLIDLLFTAGVNHIFYHGSCYSPDDAPWPGWLFYASTQMNPRNPIWRDLSALNAYVARCQSVLQAGRPDNDMLLYWPIYDLWHNPDGRLIGLTVHNARQWLLDQPVGRTAKGLWDAGFAFDFVSDRQLLAASTRGGMVHTPGGSYKAIVVPPCQHMPVETLRKLLSLAEGGCTIIFDGGLPQDVPGLARIEERRAQLRGLLEHARPGAVDPHGVAWASVGKGRLAVGAAQGALLEVGIPSEGGAADGLRMVRRTDEHGAWYFIVNAAAAPFDGWARLARGYRSVVLMDPMTGRTGAAAMQTAGDNCTQVYLQLEPGESVLARALNDPVGNGPAWRYWRRAGASTPLDGAWQVSFISGGPTLPQLVSTKALASWTELGGDDARRFAGTARYRLTFDSPLPGHANWVLDLGRVCQSARVRLNGQELGVLFAAPFRVIVSGLRPTGNVLEVEVTSTAANRIRDMDRSGVPWKRMRDINLVNIDYKPFDASGWPLHDAGLLGPVTLTPISPRNPAAR